MTFFEVRASSGVQDLRHWLDLIGVEFSEFIDVGENPVELRTIRIDFLRRKAEMRQFSDSYHVFAADLHRIILVESSRNASRESRKRYQLPAAANEGNVFVVDLSWRPIQGRSHGDKFHLTHEACSPRTIDATTELVLHCFQLLSPRDTVRG